MFSLRSIFVAAATSATIVSAIPTGSGLPPPPALPSSISYLLSLPIPDPILPLKMPSIPIFGHALVGGGGLFGRIITPRELAKRGSSPGDIIQACSGKIEPLIVKIGQ
jgi:hypothetical protein